MADVATPSSHAEPAPRSLSSEVDAALCAQLAVAWAGEGGEEPRLGWWRTDLVSEFGGEDLFQRLLPSTWRWATLQAAREAARRRDADLRRQEHDPDGLITLFHLGPELDERLDDRLQSLKHGDLAPHDALPALRHVVTTAWRRDVFADWVAGHGAPDTTTTPVGRRLRGDPPPLDRLVPNLVAALTPLADTYPLPHYRKPA